ncbi:MAG: hypothetical protein WC067_00915 [Candidatus Methanomethylophilaceae archaeon]
MIEEAASMIEEAVKMTGLERRASKTVAVLRELSSSEEDSGSIVNLQGDIHYSQEEHPGWTRPFASVKYVNRKDI